MLPLHIQGGLAVNPVTSTQVFVGDYYGGGLYRSDDSGVSWTLVLSDTAVRAVAVHPLTPTIVLAGDREEGLYRSADGGNSWMPIDAATGFTDPHIRALGFASAAPDMAYAGASQYVFRSTDAGQTWALSGTLPSNVHALAIHPVTPTLVYAGTFSHGIYRGTGSAWVAINDGLPDYAWVTSLAMHPVTPTVVYAGAWDGQVYRSTDGGDSWIGLGYLGHVYTVLIHPHAPSVVYAATSNSGVFRGSALDHLTMTPVDSSQYVWCMFPITLTARDELGFPLTGESQQAFSSEESPRLAAGFLTAASSTQLATMQRTDQALAETLAAGSFNGTATLTDTTGTITPTLVTFTDGVAVVDVSISTDFALNVITAAIPGGPVAMSNSFDVVWRGRVYLPLTMRR